MTWGDAEIRSKTIEEIRALIVAEEMEAQEYQSCGEGTCGSYEPVGYTLDQINKVLDKAKESKPLWEASVELPKEKSGFTLIELMIVVAIIGILTAIIVPKFERALACQRNKNSTQCQQAQRSW